MAPVVTTAELSWRAALTWEVRDPDPQVLHITNMWPDASRPVYGIFVKRQIDSLRRRGLRCDVLYVRGHAGPQAYAAAAVYCTSLGVRAARRYRLVHAHAGETALAAGFARGVPLVASYCGDDILGYADADGRIPAASRLRSWAVRRHSALFTATITKSREMELALPGRSRRRNRVIPNGVDTSLFAPMPQAEARSMLGWPAGDRVVLFAATRPHETRKRLDLARAAVACAELEVGAITLAIAENRAPSDVPALMNAADCLLLTSRSEGSPNAVKEAVMCNLPVVSTRVGDVAEVLDGVSHSHVCADRPEELGRRLAATLRAGARSNGRERKAAELDSRRIADRLLALYASLGVSLAVAGSLNGSGPA
jgi:glycosyltransferase involved in cell wall biosynthesis